MGNLEAVLNPTVGKSVENFFMDKMEKSIKTNRFSDLEYLGISMIEAGNDFGPGTAYGILLKIFENFKLKKKFSTCKNKVNISLFKGAP